ncbi:thymidine kinase [Aeromonas phage vB_AsaP_MQM1]|nr:thymidine kinase [Aeromonas phage vB_AsaP_MQM1]
MSGKIIFTHGTMEAGKSAEVIQKAYLFTQKGKRVVVLKSASDIRDPHGKVRSRIGIEWPCLLVGNEDHIDVLLHSQPIDIILVDEAQFLQVHQVDELAKFADEHNVLVIAYGLKNDFYGHLFPATQRFFEIADRIDETPSMCQCGKKATHHFRKVRGTGNPISCGAADKYQSVCRQCFNKLMEGRYEGSQHH